MATASGLPLLVAPAVTQAPLRPLPELQRHVAEITDKIEAAEGTARELRFWLELHPHRTREFESLIQLLESESSANRDELADLKQQLQMRLTGDSAIDDNVVLTDGKVPPAVRHWLNKTIPKTDLPPARRAHKPVRRGYHIVPAVDETDEPAVPPVLTVEPPRSLAPPSRPETSKRSSWNGPARSTPKPPASVGPILDHSQSPMPIQSHDRPHSVAGLVACVVCGYGVPEAELNEHVNAHFSPRRAVVKPPASAGTNLRTDTRTTATRTDAHRAASRTVSVSA